MIKGIEEGFLDYFIGLEDPRSQRNRLYTMSEILLVTLCAAICGADGWQDVEDYGKLKIDYLREYLPYKNGIPSDDTFRRFFRSINPESFQELFRDWVKSLISTLKQKVIAIDGKSLRHSFDGQGNMLHMISAYATEARLVLAQEKVSEKSNEITAIPKLLEWLDIRGSIVTIDAMGCQYKIADKILKNEGQYIFSLKGNQGELCEDVKIYFESDDLKLMLGLDFYEDNDKGHGRIESRKCWVSNEVSWLRDRHPQWESIQSIVRIDSTREIKTKITTETRYYISSLNESAQKILSSIRSHWAIENSLHWVLDMSFGEDQSRIRKNNAPQAMAIIRHIALNLLQLTKAQMKRQSIKRLRKMAGWDNPTLTTILNQTFS
jgi:predicted transposase YbfD/YdcC